MRLSLSIKLAALDASPSKEASCISENSKCGRNRIVLVLDAYAESAKLTNARLFSLRDQMLRAATSVPANLAEGCGRTGDREFRRFVRVALGSASELEYHLLLARDLGVLPDPAYERLASAAVEVKRMLSGLAQTLSGDQERG